MTSSAVTKVGPIKKRNRGIVSCTECHRRKQKCDRGNPCSDCDSRGLGERCKYLTQQKPSQAPLPTLKAEISRMKRLFSGEEVELTHESVEALKWATAQTTQATLIELHESDLDNSIPAASNTVSFMLPIRPKSPNVASGLAYTFPIESLGGLDPFSILPDIDGAPALPLPKQLLIRYYLDRLAPWVSYLDDLRSEGAPNVAWLPFALQHKPFFCATLLASAVHLNRRRKLRDPSALTWFKVQTIRLVNQYMSDPVEAAKDEMIMTALILLYFNVGGANVDEFEIHLRGIHQMIKLRGGLDKLGMRGMVKNWLMIGYGPWQPTWEYGQFHS